MFCCKWQTYLSLVSLDIRSNDVGAPGVVDEGVDRVPGHQDTLPSALLSGKGFKAMMCDIIVVTLIKTYRVTR